MSDQLRADLSAALRTRAAQVPQASIDRLTRLDYRPRTRGVRPPVAIGAAAATAGAAAAAVAVAISLSAGASNAFAGWSPTPTAPSPSQLAQSRAECAAHAPVAGLPLQLTDTRGPFTFSVYADSTSSATCISGPSFTAVSGSTSSAPVVVPTGAVQLSTAHQTNGDGQAYSFAEGHAGSGVTGVALVLADGTNVQATLQNGWFVAWWPSAETVKSADVTTPAGVKTQTLNDHPGPPGAPDGQRRSGSSFGSASGSSSGGGPGVSVQSYSGVSN
jgi:hypothetical protein